MMTVVYFIKCNFLFNSFQAIFTASTMTSLGCLNMAVFLPSLTTSSLEITWIEANSHWKQSVYSQLIKSSTQKISSCFEEITNAPASIAFTDFTMNVCKQPRLCQMSNSFNFLLVCSQLFKLVAVFQSFLSSAIAVFQPGYPFFNSLLFLQVKGDTISDCGRRSLIASTVCQSPRFQMRKFSAAMEVSAMRCLNTVTVNYKNTSSRICCYYQCFYSPVCTFFSGLGLSPDLQSMEQIRRIMRPTDVPDQGTG